MKVANGVARFMGIPETFTQEMMQQHIEEIDGNAREQTVHADDPTIAHTLTRLRRLYGAQIKELYQFFDDAGIEFEEFKEWPRAGVFTELWSNEAREVAET